MMAWDANQKTVLHNNHQKRSMNSTSGISQRISERKNEEKCNRQTEKITSGSGTIKFLIHCNPIVRAELTRSSMPPHFRTRETHPPGLLNCCKKSVQSEAESKIARRPSPVHFNPRRASSTQTTECKSETHEKQRPLPGLGRRRLLLLVSNQFATSFQ
ncbi:hypothetical protein M758_1G305400 [Ceratodon purpureus]|nr:hypothetical protein M758_1G305400 [Ceratodon purpureus]